MKDTKKKIFVTAAAIVVWTIVALLLAGCHTVSGIGQDLQTMTDGYLETRNY